MVPNTQPLVPGGTKTNAVHGTLKMRLSPDKSVTNSDQHQNRERKVNIRVGEGKEKKKEEAVYLHNKYVLSTLDLFF